MSISSIGSSGCGVSSYGLSKLTDQVFSRLDTQQQGYLLASDIQGALGSDSGDSSQAQAVVEAMDSDGDGKLTRSELGDALERVAGELGAQMLLARADSPPPPPPPPPPDGEDTGKTVDELSAMAGDAPAGSRKASDLSALVESFDEADTNSDGKVTFQEAMEFRRSQDQDAATADTANAQGQGDAVSRVVRLIAEYLGSSDDSAGGSTRLLNTVA